MGPLRRLLLTSLGRARGSLLSRAIVRAAMQARVALLDSWRLVPPSVQCTDGCRPFRS